MAVKKGASAGITLLELLVVLAIILLFSAGIAVALRQTERRVLHNTSLQLQADLRYAQRRAVIEGRQFGIVFDIATNSYRIVSTMPAQTVRMVELSGGVQLIETSGTRLMFHPRGTPTAGFRITLGNGTHTQRLTATVSGGRIRVYDINQPFDDE